MSHSEPTPLGLFFVVAAILSSYFLPWSLTTLKYAIPTIWAISKFSIVPQLLYIIIFQNYIYRNMETQVSALLDLMKSNSVALPIIQGALFQLKADVKHKHVPPAAVASIFDIIRLALVPTEYLDTGFSILTHLTRRLISQRQTPLLELQARRTIPLLFELFDHDKERVRRRAVQALSELCHISFAVFNHVENVLRDEGLRSQSTRIIPAMHQEKVLDSIHNYSYTSLLVECLRHNEAIVVIAAKKALIQLYRDTEDRGKDELKFKLRQRLISEPIMEDIIAQITPSKDITITLPTIPEPQPSRPRAVNRAVIEVKALHNRSAENSDAPIHAVTAEPIQVTEAPPAASTSSLDKPTSQSTRPRATNRAVIEVKALHNRPTETSEGPVTAQPIKRTEAPPAASTSSLNKPTTSSSTPSLPGKSVAPTITTSLSSKSATINATTSLPDKPSEVDVQPLPYLPKPSPAELEAAKLEPLYVESAKDLEATFADMLPHFAGKETGENWTRREQSALKIRRLTRGNGPEDYLPQYTAAIKSMSDGLVKGCMSLRTTLCTVSCHCVQDIARKLRQGLDPMVEIYLQCFLKLCANTKPITSASGNSCVAELISCATFSNRISHHLLNATQDKNVQPRRFASEWLMIVLTRYGRQRSPLDQHLDNLTTAISNGLNDRDKGVREAMRPTFWAYARLWNEKSKTLIAKLDKKHQEALLSDTTNPFPQDWFGASMSATAAPAQSTSNPKQSMRDTIAQQRLQNQATLSRSGSAAEMATPARDISARMPARPKSSQLTTRRPVLATSTGSMSSAPVRPNRLARKPDTKTEAKVDIKADDLPTGRTAETPATKSHQIFATHTPAKVSAKATPAPVATVESVPDSEEPPDAEPTATAPDTHKRVSWSEDDLPVEFSSWKPPNEVSLALIGKTSTDPVDTITRNPVNGRMTTPVGEALALLLNSKTNSSDRQLFRCPSDGTLASLQVEPSELPASETTHLSVDGTFSIPAPEVAALSTPRVPRRSSLKSSNQPDIKSEHRVSSDAPSVTAHNKTDTTAPTSIEVNSQPPEFGTASRLSQSPRPLASRKEGMKSVGDSQRLKVYEDEEEMSEDIFLQLALKRGSPPPSPPPGSKAILSELPVNTDKPKRRNSFSAKMTTDQNVSIHQTRQVMGRAVPRMHDGTLDHEGYKNLRGLINKDNLWATGEEGQPVFDDLVQSLSFVVQGGSPYADMVVDKLRMLRLQALYTLNALMAKNRKALEKWSQHILRSVAVSYEDYPNSDSGRMQHISLVMARLAENMLDMADQPRNLDTLFKLLETNQPLKHNVLALQLLTIALDKGNADVDKTTEARLGRITCRCIPDFETDVRIAGTRLAKQMYGFVRPESRFWQLLFELSEEQKNLVAYFLAKP